MKAPDKKDFRPRIPVANREEVFTSAKAVGKTPTAYVYDVVMRACREEPGNTASQKHLAEFRTIAERIACVVALICTRSAYLMRRVEAATSKGDLMDAYFAGRLIDVLERLEASVRDLAELLRDVSNQSRPSKGRSQKTGEKKGGHGGT